MYRNKIFILLLSALLTGLAACIGDKPERIPKPKAYFRIPEPEKKYLLYDSLCPFSFEYPAYGIIKPYTRGNEARPCWFDLRFPLYNATLYISYEDVKGDVRPYLEDSRTLVYKHTVKANAIDEILVSDPEHKVYGIIYQIQGDAASNCQFHLTDSLRHFIRGSLYFNASANADSVAPALSYLRKDVEHITETMRWK